MTTTWDEVTTSVTVSPYALQHPEHYRLRPVMSRNHRNLQVELCLLDADDEFVDEDGCNCDMDAPCNNPTCVHERRWF